MRTQSYRIDRAGSLEGLKLHEGVAARPENGEVLVALRTASIGQRDLAVIFDHYVHGIPAGLVPFSDGAGEVIDIGPGVTRLKVGDRVVPTVLQRWLAGPRQAHYSGSGLGGSIDGTLRTHGVFREEALVPFPSHLSFQEGAAFGLSGLSAWAALTSGRPVRPGDWIVVQSSGTVGLLALQLAKLFGAGVIVTTRKSQNAERLAGLGADAVIDINHEPDWPNAVKTLTGGRGADRVIDLVGPSAMDKSIEALAINGHLSALGNLGGPGAIDPLKLVGKGKVIEGIGGGSRHQFAALMDAVARAEIRPAIDSVFSFAEAKKAISHYEKGDRFGRVIIEISG